LRRVPAPQKDLRAFEVNLGESQVAVTFGDERFGGPRRFFRAEELSPRATELGFDLRRRNRADDLPRRDLVTFVHGERRQPARIFGGDVDLCRFDAPVRFDDPIGHGATA
jgi:hypothetical protein